MSNSTLWQTVQNWKSDRYTWVDLSYTVSPKTPHYGGFNDLAAYDILTFDRDRVCSREYKLVSQYGTHVDPPSHFIQGGRALHQLDIREMAYPLCVVDVSEKAAADHDYALTRADLEAWEAANGRIPPGSFVAMRTDWHKREGEAFFNRDASGDCHYPGWSAPALTFLCQERQVGAIGHEPPDTDPAITAKTALWAGELYYLGHDKFQIEMLRNLDQLPATGAIIFCTFPAIEDAPGFTARCFAIFEKP